MAEIVIPVTAPGADKTTADVAALRREIAGLPAEHAKAERAARQMGDAEKKAAQDAASAAKQTRSEQAQAAQAQRNLVSQRISQLGRVQAVERDYSKDAAKAAKEAEKAWDKFGNATEKVGGSVGSVLNVLSGRTGLLGGTFLAVGAAAGSAFAEISANIEQASKRVLIYAEAAKQAKQILSDAKDARDAKAADNLLNGADNRRALIALGGDDAIKEATNRATALGISPDEAIKADLDLRRGGFNDELRSGFYEQAGAMHKGGVQTFGDSIKAAQTLGVDRFGRVLGEGAGATREAMANAEAYSKYAEERDNAPTTREVSHEEALKRFQKLVDEHDREQGYGAGFDDTTSIPLFSEFLANLAPDAAPEAAPFAPAAGRSAEDIDAAMKRTEQSDAARAMREAAEAEARRKKREADAAKKHGPQATRLREAKDRVENLTPGISDLQKAFQDAQADYELEQRKTALYQKNHEYASGLGLFSDMGNRRRAEDDAFTKMQALGDALTAAAKELRAALEEERNSAENDAPQQVSPP